MMVHPKVATVVGQVTEHRWGQVLQTPHAYGVVEINSLSGEARRRGISVLTELTAIFDEPPVSLSQLSEIADRIMKDYITSLILLVPVGMTLYMVSRGNGRVFLRRGNKLAILIQASQSLSGDIRTGDVMIAATPRFTQTLTPQEIGGVFDHLDPTEVAERLTMRLHEKAGGEGGAALIFQVGEAPIEEELPLSPPIVAQPLIIHRAKALGRRVTTIKQRVLLRKISAIIRAHPAFTGTKLIMYTVIVLFLMSVVLGIRHQQSTKTQSSLASTLTQAQHSFDEGMALLDLNPVKGRERLRGARDLLLPVISRKLKTEDGQKANRLYKEVLDNLTRSMHIAKVTPELFYDVSLLKKGGVITDISLFEDMIGILDSVNKTVFVVGAESKSGTIIGGGAPFTGSSHIAAYGDKVYVWTPNGIHMIRLSDQKTVEHSIPMSSEWGTILDMVSFGGNVYLLDNKKSRIWKYVATERGFSELFEYLNPDTLPDLTKTTNMAIDGSVWLGTASGGVIRFTSGKENPYTLQGADKPLGINVEVYTDDSLKMVYVLDPDNHRVVVFDKDGLYMAQYVWENTFRAAQIAVSERLHKVLLRADGKLYGITLQ